VAPISPSATDVARLSRRRGAVPGALPSLVGGVVKTCLGGGLAARPALERWLAAAMPAFAPTLAAIAPAQVVAARSARRGTGICPGDRSRFASPRAARPRIHCEQPRCGIDSSILIAEPCWLCNRLKYQTMNW